jgi:hypothetical protein
MSQREWTETSEAINAMLVILEAEHPMTVRQLFYRLVSSGAISNSTGEYRRVSRLITKARRDDRCPYEYLVDRSRPTYAPNVFEDCATYVSAVSCSYRKDHWELQPRHVEVWCEKDAVIGSIEGTTDKLGITVRVARGFMSATRVNDIAGDLERIGKPTTVLYIGDHDPSGHCIEQAARNAVLARYSEITDNELEFEMVRLAIHQRDIKQFRLPPLRVKDADPRADEYRRKFGGQCVELDALPPSELRRRIQRAVAARRDERVWQKSIHIEQVEIESIVSFAQKMRAGSAG